MSRLFVGMAVGMGIVILVFILVIFLWRRKDRVEGFAATSPATLQQLDANKTGIALCNNCNCNAITDWTDGSPFEHKAMKRPYLQFQR